MFCTLQNEAGRAENAFKLRLKVIGAVNELSLKLCPQVMPVMVDVAALMYIKLSVFLKRILVVYTRTCRH